MRAVLNKKIKGSAMLWCVILMSILALVVMVSVSVAAAYDSSVVKNVCLNQLEYDAESALEYACSSICTGEIYQEGTKPDVPLFREGGAEIVFDGNASMGTVSLQWNEAENIITAVASVPDYGERSVSAVIQKTDRVTINNVSLPDTDEEGEPVEYLPSTVFEPNYYYYWLDGDTSISQLDYNGRYFFKGTEYSDSRISFDPVGNNYVSADIYINLSHSEKLEICNVPPNVRIFVFPSPGDPDNEAEVTLSGSEKVKGFITCGTLKNGAEIELEMPDESIVAVTKGYSYEFVRYTD